MEKKYPAIKKQFNKLTKEWIPQLNRYFLDKNFNDYQRIDRFKFRDLFTTDTRSDRGQKGSSLVLLSTKGMLKLLARSNNDAMKVILIYLTEYFEKQQFNPNNSQMVKALECHERRKEIDSKPYEDD